VETEARADASPDLQFLKLVLMTLEFRAPDCALSPSSLLHVEVGAMASMKVAATGGPSHSTEACGDPL
jgi:hypothetical protein